MRPVRDRAPPPSQRSDSFLVPPSPHLADKSNLLSNTDLVHWHLLWVRADTRVDAACCAVKKPFRQNALLRSTDDDGQRHLPGSAVAPLARSLEKGKVDPPT